MVKDKEIFAESIRSRRREEFERRQRAREREIAERKEKRHLERLRRKIEQFTEESREEIIRIVKEQEEERKKVKMHKPHEQSWSCRKSKNRKKRVQEENAKNAKKSFKNSSKLLENAKPKWKRRRFYIGRFFPLFFSSETANRRGIQSHFKERKMDTRNRISCRRKSMGAHQSPPDAFSSFKRTFPSSTNSNTRIRKPSRYRWSRRMATRWTLPSTNTRTFSRW